MTNNQNKEFRLTWECPTCKEEYATTHNLKAIQNGSMPKAPDCPECGVKYPRKKGFEIID